MITCTLRYEIDPDQLEAFEVYGKAWIHLVEKLGGTHHGYHLPHEGPNDIAYAHSKRTKCIRRFDRSFTKPLMDGATVDELGL